MDDVDQLTTPTSQAGAEPEQFDVVNPATGEVVGRYPVHTQADVAAAVARAREAQKWWLAQGYAGRKGYVARWLRYLALHCDEVYDIGHAETARPRDASRLTSRRSSMPTK